jgi:hypothetical protein
MANEPQKVPANKEAVLKQFQVKTHQVDIPTLNASVHIAELTVGQREQLLLTLVGEGDGSDIKGSDLLKMQVLYVSFAWVNEDGSQMFSVDELKKMSSTAQEMIEQVYKEADKINGLMSQSEDDIAKN